jgi:hypothetical protein
MASSFLEQKVDHKADCDGDQANCDGDRYPTRLATGTGFERASGPRAIYVDGGVTLYPGFETGG